MSGCLCFELRILCHCDLGSSSVAFVNFLSVALTLQNSVCGQHIIAAGLRGKRSWMLVWCSTGCSPKSGCFGAKNRLFGGWIRWRGDGGGQLGGLRP